MPFRAGAPVVRQALWLAALALIVWATSTPGLDLAASALFYDAARSGFYLRDNWLLAAPGHTGLRSFTVLAWGLILLVALVPGARLASWRGAARQAALGMLLSWAVVSGLRALSLHSCPVDLVEFGGSAEWFPLFGAPTPHPGPGRCFPAAHAVSGFAFFALYFALRERWPRAARIALLAACLIGALASAVQVARGAHFVSHALWTAWLCWTVNWLLDRLAGARLRGATARRAA